jgi:hypothetical protein
MIDSLSAGLEVSTRAAEGATVGPVVESPLMLFVPTRNLRQLKREVVSVPDVDQEREDGMLVGAQRFFAKLDGILGLVVFRESVSANQDRRDAETFG